MVQLICLANSWKYEERCIAGIEPTTGKWIRPVSTLCDAGQVPAEVRLIDGIEPALLDILDIPLEQNYTSPDFGYGNENRTLATGCWKRLGKAKATDVLPYCSPTVPVLHTPGKSVTVSYLQRLPLTERRSLQLIYTTTLSIQSIWKVRGGRKWQGVFALSDNQQFGDIRITDPEFVERLESGYRPQNPCLLTLSLSMPFSPDDDWKAASCWKLIAGVIELSIADLILVEMHRLGWSVDQGREYLQHTYRKRSRHQLTPRELSQFLNYLKSLPI